MASVTKPIFLDETAENIAENINKIASALGYIDLVSFHDGTDEQIAKMLAAADAGLIDLAEDAGWAVGDTRVLHLSKLEKTGTYDGVSWEVGEENAEGDYTFVIMDTDHYDLVDGGKSKFVIGMKNRLVTGGYMNPTNTNAGSWESCKRRPWCNGAFRQALPDYIRPFFKKFKVITAKEYNSTDDPTPSEDYFALFAEKEIFGADASSYANAKEKEYTSQIKWYETAANRIKTIGDSGSANGWWQRSPSSNGAVSFRDVVSGGAASYSYASNTYGLSPFGCI